MIHLNKQNYSKSNFCLVCGYDLRKDNVDFPDCNTIIEYSQEYCPCCSVQIGYTYAVDDGAGAKEFRKYWAETLKYAFEDEDLKPEVWNKEMALKQIETNVPKELL
tara:strand:- start:217 stop:534 length:318 start_codon:yes stop_codon:yes gene_type:complete